jgi:hypothetical protein
MVGLWTEPPKGLPERYHRLVRMAFERGVLSRIRAAEYLGQSPGDIWELEWGEVGEEAPGCCSLTPTRSSRRGRACSGNMAQPRMRNSVLPGHSCAPPESQPCLRSQDDSAPQSRLDPIFLRVHIMGWEVEYTDEFFDWFDDLAEAAQDGVCRDGRAAGGTRT